MRVTTSSMSGSSIDRSRTSARAATAASTVAAVVVRASKASRCRSPPPSLPTCACRACRSGRGAARTGRRPAPARRRPWRPARAASRRRPAGRGRRPAPGRRAARCRPCRGWSAAGWCRGWRARWRRNSRSRSLLSTSRPMVGSSRISSSRRVQQRGRDLAAHPLAEATAGAPGCPGSRPSPAARPARRVRRLPRAGGQPVDRGQHAERLAQRQVPPQLAALAEDHADPPGQRRAGCRTGSSPQVRTVPDVGTRMPVSILIVVDLPAPLAPM